MRSLVAVVAGCVVFVAIVLPWFWLQGHAPEEVPSVAFAIASVFVGLVSALLAGWTTARLTPSNGISHTIVLAFAITIGALVSFFFGPGIKWPQMLTMFVFSPTVIGGGFLGQRAEGAEGQRAEGRGQR
jgi:hypothetical protein